MLWWHVNGIPSPVIITFKTYLGGYLMEKSEQTSNCECDCRNYFAPIRSNERNSLYETFKSEVFRIHSEFGWLRFGVRGAAIQRNGHLGTMNPSHLQSLSCDSLRSESITIQGSWHNFLDSKVAPQSVVQSDPVFVSATDLVISFAKHKMSAPNFLRANSFKNFIAVASVKLY